MLIDLAAAFRWAVRLDMHEAVANHFSLAIEDYPSQAEYHFDDLKRLLDKDEADYKL